MGTHGKEICAAPPRTKRRRKGGKEGQEGDDCSKGPPQARDRSGGATSGANGLQVGPGEPSSEKTRLLHLIHAELQGFAASPCGEGQAMAPPDVSVRSSNEGCSDLCPAMGCVDASVGPDAPDSTGEIQSM